MIKIDRPSRRPSKRMRQSQIVVTVMFNLVRVVDRKLIFKKFTRNRDRVISDMSSLNLNSINWSHKDRIKANVLEIVSKSRSSAAVLKSTWRCVICLQRRRTFWFSSRTKNERENSPFQMNGGCWRAYLWRAAGEHRLGSFEVTKNGVEDKWWQQKYLSVNRVQELIDEFAHEDEEECFDKDVPRVVHPSNVHCIEIWWSSSQSNQGDGCKENHERCDSIVDEHQQRSTGRQPSLVLGVSSGKFHRATREDDDASAFRAIELVCLIWRIYMCASLLLAAHRNNGGRYLL